MSARPVFKLTADDLVERCRQAGFEAIAEETRALIRPAINLRQEVRADDEIGVGRSKIGGRADLQPGVDWPMTDDGFPMSFLAQINLAHAARYDVNKELPPSGLLSFFFDTQRMPWGFDPSDRGKWVVLYQPDVTHLAHACFPESLPSDCRFGAAAVGFRRLVNLPNARQIEMERFKLSQEQLRTYIWMELDTRPGLDVESAQLLGNPSIIQCEMQRECQMASNGVYYGDRKTLTDPRVHELEPGAAQWRLLFQLPSQEDHGMYWGGVGYLYFMIRDADLTQWDLRNVWLVLQGT